MPFEKQYSREEAKQKIRHYCAYQERCHKEVKEKLYSFKLRKAEVEELLSDLIEENFLNEERFAQHFVRGKFALKNWGKTKIVYALKQKGISEYCINKAIKTIDGNNYQQTIKKLAEKKLQLLKSEKNIFVKKTKLRNYLLQKGFETKLVYEYLGKL